MLKAVMDGTVKIFTASEDDPFTNSEARGAIFVAAIATTIATSIFTRKRAEEGKEAIAGIFL